MHACTGDSKIVSLRFNLKISGIELLRKCLITSEYYYYTMKEKHHFHPLYSCISNAAGLLTLAIPAVIPSVWLHKHTKQTKDCSDLHFVQ